MVNNTVNGATSGSISLADYARHRRISPPAVTKAVKRGQLRASVELVNGQPKIRDIAQADQEWASNVRPRPAAHQPVKGAAPRSMRPAQRWGVVRIASGNVAVVLFNDAEAVHDREYEDQFVGAAHGLNKLPPMGPDGYPDVFVEMGSHTARALAAALLEKAGQRDDR
jgi:hypothetical protein